MRACARVPTRHRRGPCTTLVLCAVHWEQMRSTVPNAKGARRAGPARCSRGLRRSERSARAPIATTRALRGCAAARLRGRVAAWPRPRPACSPSCHNRSDAASVARARHAAPHIRCARERWCGRRRCALQRPRPTPRDARCPPRLRVRVAVPRSGTRAPPCARGGGHHRAGQGRYGEDTRIRARGHRGAREGSSAASDGAVSGRAAGWRRPYRRQRCCWRRVRSPRSGRRGHDPGWRRGRACIRRKKRTWRRWCRCPGAPAFFASRPNPRARRADARRAACPERARRRARAKAT